MGHRGTTMTLVGVVLALGCTITPVWGSHRNFGVLNPESTAANGLKDSAASVVITTTSEQSKRLLESETHCTCTHKCEVHCATELKVCCGTRGSSCNCSALGTCPVCVPNHFDLDDLGPPTVTYDLTLGYVFPPGPEVFPVGYWTVGGTGTVYTPKFRALITRGDNYSVYNLCGRACQDFEPSAYWNGSRCDAFTVTVDVDGGRALPARTVQFNCTLLQFASLRTGPGTPIDSPCPGCATGVAHKVWDGQHLYSLVLAVVLIAHGCHVIYVSYRHRHATDAREYILLTIETFVPITFAAIEMSTSACSTTQEFAPALLTWMALACLPRVIHTKHQIASATAAEELVEALQHNGGGTDAWEAHSPSAIRLLPDTNSVNGDGDDDDDALLVQPFDVLRVRTEVSKLEQQHAAAEAKVDTYEVVFQYSNGLTASILLHLFFIVRNQPARANTALLFLFFGLDHAIPLAVWTALAVCRSSDRKRVKRGLWQFGRNCLGFLRATTVLDALRRVLTSGELAMLISVGYSSYFLAVVLHDYASTSGAHVTCPEFFGGVLTK